MGYQDSGNCSCTFYIGNCHGNNRGNNKIIQKNVGGNFADVFNRKSFGDSSAGRCNQRISTCEFDIDIWIYQCGNYVAKNVS